MNAEASLETVRETLQTIVDSHYDLLTIQMQLHPMELLEATDFILGSVYLAGEFLKSAAPQADRYAMSQLEATNLPPEVERAHRNAAAAIIGYANGDHADARYIIEAAVDVPDGGGELAHLAMAVIQTLHGLEHMFGRRPVFRP